MYILSMAASERVAEEKETKSSFSIFFFLLPQYADSDLTLTCSLYLTTTELKRSNKSQRSAVMLYPTVLEIEMHLVLLFKYL